jgi:hypothetical protein
MKRLSLYQEVMGSSFAALPAALQEFHSLEGKHVLDGWADVEGPATFPAKCMAWCLGAPTAAHSGPIRFELQAGAASEVWTRHFPLQTMRSRLTLAGARVVERLGPARLVFALQGGPDKLDMQLESMHFLGIPCPRWLRPAIVAEETATAGRLHFRVRASLPMVGLVTSYRGHLDVPDGDAA